MIAVARQESGARKLEGHDIMALERFDPEVKHMIIFDVLSRESGITVRLQKKLIEWGIIYEFIS